MTYKYKVTNSKDTSLDNTKKEQKKHVHEIPTLYTHLLCFV